MSKALKNNSVATFLFLVVFIGAYHYGATREILATLAVIWAAMCYLVYSGYEYRERVLKRRIQTEVNDNRSIVTQLHASRAKVQTLTKDLSLILTSISAPERERIEKALNKELSNGA